MELVLPSAAYKESFLAAIREQIPGEVSIRYEGVRPDEIAADFDSFVRREREKSEGKHLPEGHVPQTDYWLVDEGEYMGRVKHQAYIDTAPSQGRRAHWL